MIRVVPRTEEILGHRITSSGGSVMITGIADCLESAGVPRFLACANPHSLVEGRRDAAFREALISADWLIPDGVGIVVASRILGGTIRARFTGTDAFLGLSRAFNEKGNYRCFFLGATGATLDRVATRYQRDFDRLTVAGGLAPEFKDEFGSDDDQRMVDAVNTSHADVLWVGMSAPKQEKWVFRNRHRLNVRFIGAIGAVFDFYAGTRRRSPQWALKTGLEWLPRLLWEPRRLWRRTLISAPVFLWLVLRERVGRQRGARP